MAYTVLLAIASLVNTGQIITAATNFDKVLHGLAYFGLALLWMSWRVFKKIPVQQGALRAGLFIIALFAVLYGVLIEFLQGALTTYRMADAWDIIANALGVVVALVIALLSINKSSMLKMKI